LFHAQRALQPEPRGLNRPLLPLPPGFWVGVKTKRPADPTCHFFPNLLSNIGLKNEIKGDFVGQFSLESRGGCALFGWSVQRVESGRSFFRGRRHHQMMDITKLYAKNTL